LCPSERVWVLTGASPSPDARRTVALTMFLMVDFVDDLSD